MQNTANNQKLYAAQEAKSQVLPAFPLFQDFYWNSENKNAFQEDAYRPLFTVQRGLCQGDLLSLWTEWQTFVKTLPPPQTSFAGGNEGGLEHAWKPKTALLPCI